MLALLHTSQLRDCTNWTCCQGTWMYWCALSRSVAWKATQNSLNEYEVNWYPYRGDAFTPYLQDRCLCGTLHPLSLTHMEDTEMQGAYQQSRTIESLLVGGRKGGGSWLLDEDISPLLLHFLVPAQEVQWQLYGEGEGGEGTSWYIVREALGQNAKHSWWKSDILFKDHVGDRQKPAPAFPKLDFKFVVYFPRWLYDLLKDLELKLLSICNVRFLCAKARTW